jgi:ribosomal protein S14
VSARAILKPVETRRTPSEGTDAVAAPSSRDDMCRVCGHTEFVYTDVLLADLVQAWELSPEETNYINIQQGTRCERCGANIRSQVLARAVVQATESFPYQA